MQIFGRHVALRRGGMEFQPQARAWDLNFVCELAAEASRVARGGAAISRTIPRRLNLVGYFHYRCVPLRGADIVDEDEFDLIDIETAP